MSSQHERLFPQRSVSIGHILLAMALALAVLVAACTAFSVDAAPLVAGETAHHPPPCLTPQATAASTTQNQLGFQLTTATTKATTTTLTPERPAPPNQPCTPPRHDGTAQPDLGTPHATPSDHQHPTHVAEPPQPAAPQPPDGPGHPGPEGPGEGSPPPPRHPAPPNHSGPPNPEPRPTSSSGGGYPGPGGS